jgi:pimeloyl-ACP methyl ester carboxylesterase
MIISSTRTIEGISVFYREAGDPSLPTIVLLGGFPASSHMFRTLLPALQDHFHLIAPDYPGFGNTDLPDPSTFAYTFDHLATIVEQLLTELGVTKAGWYLQDYGGPIGNRVIGRHPDWVEWLIIQNANSYEEGFTEAWDGLRHALWVDRSPKNEAAIEAFLEPDGVKSVYQTGHRYPGTWIFIFSLVPMLTVLNSNSFTIIGTMSRSIHNGKNFSASINLRHSFSGAKGISSLLQQGELLICEI